MVIPINPNQFPQKIETPKDKKQKSNISNKAEDALMQTNPPESPERTKKRQLKKLEEESSKITSQFEVHYVEKAENIKEISRQDFELIQDDDLQKKSVGFYDCIRKVYDELSSGYFYTITPNKSYQQAIERNDKSFAKQLNLSLFPAVQPSPSESFIDIESVITNQPDLKYLGYEIDIANHTITLPDVNVLNQRWMNLVEWNDFLPRLNFISSDGKADDTPFVNAFLEKKVILSKNSEFVHDHLVHILPFLNICLELQMKKDDYFQNFIRYQKVTKQFRDSIQKLSDFLDKLDKGISVENKSFRIEPDKLRACLGIAVDIFTSRSSLDDLEEVLEDLNDKTIITKLLTTSELWKKYFYQNLGIDDEVKLNDLFRVWGYLIDHLKQPNVYSVENLINS